MNGIVAYTRRRYSLLDWRSVVLSTLVPVAAAVGSAVALSKGKFLEAIVGAAVVAAGILVAVYPYAAWPCARDEKA